MNKSWTLRIFKSGFRGFLQPPTRIAVHEGLLLRSKVQVRAPSLCWKAGNMQTVLLPSTFQNTLFPSKEDVCKKCDKVRGKSDNFVRTAAKSKIQHQKQREKNHEESSDDSDWDSDSDDGGDDDDDSGRDKHFSKERGESEFWKTKMRTLHRVLDINKDGVVSFDDFKLLTEKFTDLGHLTPEHHDEFQEKMQEAWEIQRGTVDDPYNLVTTEQFLEDMHHILNDKTLRKKVHGFLPFFFKAVDHDHNGEITVDNYKIFFKCLGLTETDAVCSFRTIDLNNDGKLALKEFVRLGREYLLSEDPKTPSKFFWGPLVDDHFHKSGRH